MSVSFFTADGYRQAAQKASFYLFKRMREPEAYVLGGMFF